MSKSTTFDPAAAATHDFIASLPLTRLPRVAAAVASVNGMEVLCAVEAALRQTLPLAANRELVWLTVGPEPGVHRLKLAAYADDNELLAEAAHEFAR